MRNIPGRNIISKIHFHKIISKVHVVYEISIKYDRQCMYNLTLRHLHVTTVAMEKQSVVHILSVCL